MIHFIKPKWISVNSLPQTNMKVKWICDDGVIDFGYYYYDKKEFATYQPNSRKAIVGWLPLNNIKVNF